MARKVADVDSDFQNHRTERGARVDTLGARLPVIDGNLLSLQQVQEAVNKKLADMIEFLRKGTPVTTNHCQQPITTNHSITPKIAPIFPQTVLSLPLKTVPSLPPRTAPASPILPRTGLLVSTFKAVSALPPTVPSKVSPKQILPIAPRPTKTICSSLVTKTTANMAFHLKHVATHVFEHQKQESPEKKFSCQAVGREVLYEDNYPLDPGITQGNFLKQHLEDKVFFREGVMI